MLSFISLTFSFRMFISFIFNLKLPLIIIVMYTSCFLNSSLNTSLTIFVIFSSLREISGQFIILKKFELLLNVGSGTMILAKLHRQFIPCENDFFFSYLVVFIGVIYLRFNDVICIDKYIYIYYIYIYIYIYIYSKYLQEKTTICDNKFRISTFQVTSNNTTNYFCRNILSSFPTKY